jgi:MFS family permease
MTAPKPEPPPPRLVDNVTPVAGSARRVVALAALMFAGFSFVTVEIAPVGLLPAISADLDVSLSAVGLLVTWYGLTVAVASIPLTRLVGAVPGRYLLSGLLVVFVAATCLSVAGPSYWALTAGRVATALSQAVFWSVAAPAAVALFSAGAGPGHLRTLRGACAGHCAGCPRGDLAGPTSGLAGGVPRRRWIRSGRLAGNRDLDSDHPA